METTTESTTKLSAIDKALAAAKARVAAKAGTDVPAANKETPSKEPKTKKETQPEFAKAAKAEALKAAREAAKAQRDVERQKRREAKAAAPPKGGAHMKKVEKAGSKLPALVDAARLLFNEVTANFSRDQVAAIALHLQHFNRVKATELAAGRTYKQGQPVRITGGDPKYIGMRGEIDSARSLRCFVNVSGFKKPVYLFTSDIEPVEEAVAAATGTEG
jgi:hypothetical protein